MRSVIPAAGRQMPAADVATKTRFPRVIPSSAQKGAEGCTEEHSVVTYTRSNINNNNKKTPTTTIVRIIVTVMTAAMAVSCAAGHTYFGSLLCNVHANPITKYPINGAPRRRHCCSAYASPWCVRPQEYSADRSNDRPSTLAYIR